LTIVLLRITILQIFADLQFFILSYSSTTSGIFRRGLVGVKPPPMT